MSGRRVPAEARFWTKLVQADDTDCWMWIAGRDTNGYGVFHVTHSVGVRAHRWAYESMVGPIPDGLTLDHLCHTRSNCGGGKACPHRRCCNPWHLEPVTVRVNVGRGHAGESSTGGRRPQTHCRNGHEYAVHAVPHGTGRLCRPCNNDYSREYQRRRRAAQLAHT